MAKLYTRKIYEEAGSPLELVIPEGYTEIGPQTFKRVKEKLKSVVFPASMKTIPNDLFANCTGLKYVEFPEGLKSIDCSFFECTSLLSVKIPGSVKEIGKSAFKRCTSLKTFTIPESIEKVGCFAFEYCDNLQSVTIPESVTEIERGAFSGCTSLRSIKIPESVTEIESGAFCDCTSLQNVYIPESVTKIGCFAFSGCTSLKSITIPESVISLESKVFKGCKSLEKVIIPDSVTAIGDYAFSECTSLLSIKIPESVKQIESCAFCDCTSLQNAYIPKSVTKISKHAFWRCTSLRSLDIPENVTKIGSYALSDCTSLRSIKIPESVTEIESCAFCDCTSLQNVYIPDSVTKIGRLAFSGCTSLKSITIPVSVMEIDENAFYNCASLQSVTILNPKIKINKRAFSGCNGIAQVNLPKGLASSKVINKFADSPRGKNKTLSGEQVAEKAKKEKLEALAAASTSAIVKHALDEAAPCTAITMVNSDNKSLSISKDLIEGIKLHLNIRVPKKLEEIQQFASALAESMKQMSDSLFSCFVGSSKECGAVFISSKKNDLVMTLNMSNVPTKGGNHVDMDIKEMEVNKFLDSVPQLNKIIEKIDGWEGVKANVDISLNISRKDCRYKVDLTDLIEVPSNLVFIDCIDSLKYGCFKHNRDVESITISRKLLSNALSECRSLKEIHVI